MTTEELLRELDHKDKLIAILEARIEVLEGTIARLDEQVARKDSRSDEPSTLRVVRDD
jgi:hypothetical protein